MSWFNADSNVPAIKKARNKLSMRDNIVGLVDHFLKDWDNNSETFQILSDLKILPLSLIETENSYLVEAELPGVKKEDIKVDVSNNILTVKGEKKVFCDDRKGQYFRMERRYGYFNRSIQLPAGVDEEKVSAQMDNGILRIEIAKSTEAMKKRRYVAIQ